MKVRSSLATTSPSGLVLPRVCEKCFYGVKASLNMARVLSCLPSTNYGGLTKVNWNPKRRTQPLAIYFMILLRHIRKRYYFALCRCLSSTRVYEVCCVSAFSAIGNVMCDSW